MAISDHVAEVGAQTLPGLSTDLVHARDQVVEAVVLLDPLGSGLGANSGHAGEVVGVLAHQRSQLGIAVGRDAVLRGDGGRRHSGEFRHTTHGVENRRTFRDQLEGVPVTGEDQHLHVVGQRLLGPGRDDVVRLISLQVQEGNVEGREHFLNQRKLAAELTGCLVPLGFVFRVFGEPEGLSRQIEGNTHVGRLFVSQHVDQHRCEAVDGVRRLAGGGVEILHGEREEGAISQRVAVE